MLALISLVIVAALVALLAWNPIGRGDDTEAPSLTVYCAAGIRQPLEAIARQYEQQYGVRIQFQYGSSGSLLSQIEVHPVGDVYIPGDDDFIQPARDKHLVREVIPLARFSLVLAVAPGNPKRIAAVDDLLRDDITFCIGNETTAIGRKTAELIGRVGAWDAFKSAAKVVKPTVTELTNDIRVGAVDAGFVWDAVARAHGLEILDIPELKQDAAATIPALVLENSENSAAALRFARYCAAPEQGQKVFAAHHYEALGIEPWEPRPTITLFSGGVNRVAIEKTLDEFGAREGIDINVVYNGCGVLVGMMRAGQQPDLYFACDVSFADDVSSLFSPFSNVSSTPMVMLVRKGNPRGIATLADLGGEGMRIGRADEQLSALGALTRRLLEDAGVYEAVRRNSRTNAPTADMLVNQLRTTEQLDAVIVYRANCSTVGDSAEIIPIDHPLAYAIQPIAVSRTTQYPLIATRLIDALHSDVSRQRFEAAGFTFGTAQP